MKKVIKMLMLNLKVHQINALYALGGTILGFALTYFILSSSISQRTEESYLQGHAEGRQSGYQLGYKVGFNTCYDEVKSNMDSISVKLTTLRILLNN